MKERKIKYVSLSPTNKGARLISGATIHSIYYKFEKCKKSLFKLLENVHYIIVDEVSTMCHEFYQLFILILGEDRTQNIFVLFLQKSLRSFFQKYKFFRVRFFSLFMIKCTNMYIFYKRWFSYIDLIKITVSARTTMLVFMLIFGARFHNGWYWRVYRLPLIWILINQ